MKRFIQTILMLWISANVLGQDIRQAKVEQFEVRLKSHADAFRNWVDNQLDLTPEQKAKLEELVAAELQNSSDRRRKAGVVRSFRSLPSTTPIWFTLSRNIENFLCNAWMRSQIPEMLSDQQQIAWHDATTERQRWTLSVNSNFVIAVLDDLIFLSDRQRDSMSEAVRLVTDESRRKRLELESGIFRFPPESSILPTAQRYLFLSGPPRDVLNSGQKRILYGHSTRVVGGGRPNTRVPLPIDAVDEKRIKEVIVEFRDKHLPDFAEYVEERVAVMHEELALTESQQRHLVVAGKGATKQCLFQWQTITIDNLLQMGKQIQGLNRPGMGTIARKVYGPSVRVIELELIWQHAITEITSSIDVQRKRPFRRTAIVEYVTAMLDKELWLSPDQREPLAALVDASFPPAINIEQPQARELGLLVTPLFRIPDDELAPVLRESQRRAWKSLQAEFKRRGDHVVLPLKDGSEVLFHVTP